MPYTSHWGAKQSFDHSHYGMVDPSQSRMLDISHCGMFDTSQYGMFGPPQYGMPDTSQLSMLGPSQYSMFDSPQPDMLCRSHTSILRSSGHSGIGSAQPGPARGSVTSDANTLLHAQTLASELTSPSLLRNDDWHPETHLAPLSEISTMFTQSRLSSTPNPTASKETDTGGGLSTAQDPAERHTITNYQAGDNDQFKLVESTAPDLADGNTKARFRCPLETCACHLSETARLRDLWIHCAPAEHALGLYHQCHYRCEFGCLLGFPDTLSRFEHYGQRNVQ